MSADFDLLILGGGCAGLSLAMQLASFNERIPKTLILEKRARYENDRTWCFWGDEKTPFASLCRHRWRAVSVANSDKSVRVECGVSPYRMLASEQFYNAAIAALSRTSRIQLQMDSQLLSEPQFRDGCWQFQTSSGALSAAMVVDTRPLAPVADDAALMWQSFLGQEIECSQPVFGPDCVELMSFSKASPDGVAFTYVLPISSTRALVEFTSFAVRPHPAQSLSVGLAAAIEQRVKGADFAVFRSEQGVLPMGLVPAMKALGGHDKRSTYVRVGLFAGAARPATGYAFQRIQRWAAHCAARIAGGRPPVVHAKDPWLLARMDRLFLSVLKRQPHLAPQMFVDLFGHADSQRVIRFLSDEASHFDYAAIVMAMPFRPFLRELCRPSSWL
jgi:lycopene beta-cyclase